MPGAGRADADALFASLREHQYVLPPGMDASRIIRQDLQGVDVVVYLVTGPFHGFLWWNYLWSTGQVCQQYVRWPDYLPSKNAQAQLLAEHEADPSCPAPPYICTAGGRHGSTWVHFKVAMACLMQCGSEAVKDALAHVSGLASASILPQLLYQGIFGTCTHLHVPVPTPQRRAYRLATS